MILGGEQMFCPKCGAQNDATQSFCRQCGLGLTAVVLAAQGNAAESLAKLKCSEKWVGQGIAALVVFTVLALGIASLTFISQEPSLFSIALINLLMGCVIALPVLLLGLRKLKQGTALLSTPPVRRLSPNVDSGEETGNPGTMLTTEIDSDFSLRLNHPSVTEHTTIELSEPRPASGQMR